MLSPARLSSSSAVGVRTGIERRKYCSGGMNASMGRSAICSSDRMFVMVLGWNSVASGLKEKCFGDAADRRFDCTVVGVGGTSVVEALDTR